MAECPASSSALYENIRKEFSARDVKDILLKMLERLETAEAARISAAKEAAGNDMVEVLRLTFPIVLEVQMTVLEELGIAKGKDGLKEFLVIANNFSLADSDVNKVFMDIRSIWLPPYK